MERIADIAAKHMGNLLKTGAYMILSSIMSSNVRNSTSTTLQQIAKDIRMVRNNLRERHEAS